MNETAKNRVDVLVIDDDAIMRELMADWLEAAGYRVHKAEGCGAALAELRRHAPALVVTDMFMPGPCGAEAIARLKAERPGIVLIAVSGYFNSGHGLSAEAALSAGADRALAKPVKRRELIQAVAELVGPPVR
ncbi:MAG TPA: response regulator [Burkholderiales bacterium]|nr:response regulator [Burkholderiales bacterium]